MILNRTHVAMYVSVVDVMVLRLRFMFRLKRGPRRNCRPQIWRVRLVMTVIHSLLCVPR